MYTQADADEILLGHRRHVGSPRTVGRLFQRLSTSVCSCKKSRTFEPFFRNFFSYFWTIINEIWRKITQTNSMKN